MATPKSTPLSVNPLGPWRLYSPVLPPGTVVLGTVTRATGETGALVRFSATGIYAQCNAGAVRTLDQRAVHDVLAEG